MTNSIRQLIELQRLKNLASGRTEGINTTKLEEEFLAFSSYDTQRSLTVKLPRTYKLEGNKIRHYVQMLSVMGIKDIDTTEHIDISGSPGVKGPMDMLVLMSLDQIDADHYCSKRSYLNPLIETIYTKGTKMIRDFSINESLGGIVECKRGPLDLKEVHLFPERFTSGPYLLSVELDTPSKSVKKLQDLDALVRQFIKHPTNMLDLKKVREATAKSKELRAVIGSISRYEVPASQRFTTQVASCIIDTPESELYYLHSPAQNINALVYFGQCPMSKQPEHLQVLDGNDNAKTLAALVQMGIYEPSSAVLQQRVAELTTLYENAVRGAGATLSDQAGHFNDLHKRLDDANRYLSAVVNVQMRRKYCLESLPEDLLEFMVAPATQDPIIHELLPRLSWNSQLKTYHDTRRFTQEFESKDHAQRTAMLEGIMTNMVFTSQQNNDVNVWLYTNHKEFCEEKNVKFRMVE